MIWSVSKQVGTNNPNRYIIATQDMKLREKLRQIPGVAILHLYGNCPTLEKESYASAQYAKEKTAERLQILDYQKEILDNMKHEQNLDGSDSKVIKKGTKKRKRLGPNPLSCKKSKKPSLSTSLSSKTETSQPLVKKKKKRMRVKVPKHVKQELLSKTS